MMEINKEQVEFLTKVKEAVANNDMMLSSITTNAVQDFAPMHMLAEPDKIYGIKRFPDEIEMRINFKFKFKNRKAVDILETFVGSNNI